MSRPYEAMQPQPVSLDTTHQQMIAQAQQHYRLTTALPYQVHIPSGASASYQPAPPYEPKQAAPAQNRANVDAEDDEVAELLALCGI